MEKGDFERKWSNAFEGAEVSPSDAVWTNIGLDLGRAAGGKMKQRSLFYKMLAAASLVFAMGVAGVYYLRVAPEVNNMTARQNQEGIENSTQPDSTSEANSLTEASSVPTVIPNTSSKQDTPISNNQSI